MRRGTFKHIPSVPGDEDEQPPPASTDRTSWALRGSQHAAAKLVDKSRDRYATMSKERRDLVDEDLKNIQELLATRVVRPEDPMVYNRLREAEKLRTRGTAIDTGVSEIAEFADMLSVAHKSMQRKRNADTDELEDADHTHEPMQTQVHQLSHNPVKYREDFINDPAFATKLVSRRRDVWCDLLRYPQYDACEVMLDKFRRRMLTKEVCFTFGEYMSHFADECGLKLFCAYVRVDAQDAMFAAFEVDARQKYFILVGLKLVDNTRPVGELAVAWSEEALKRYQEMQMSTETAPFAKRPCTTPDIGADFKHWALYDVTTCKAMQNQRVALQYAYYTTCQCISLSAVPKAVSHD